MRTNKIAPDKTNPPPHQIKLNLPHRITVSAAEFVQAGFYLIHSLTCCVVCSNILYLLDIVLYLSHDQDLRGRQVSVTCTGSHGGRGGDNYD